MVGNDGHHINYANGIKGEAGKRLFNLLNCLLLAEKKPATVNMLEAAYLEVMLTNIQNIHCSDDIYITFLTSRWRVQQCPTTSLVSLAGSNSLLLGLTLLGSGGQVEDQRSCPQFQGPH